MTEVPQRRRRDLVLSSDFVQGIADLELTQVRQRRQSAEAEEAELSYQRRLVQSRIDVMRNELDRRQHSISGPQAVADVLEVLTAELVGEPRHQSPAVIANPLTVQRRAVERLLADPALAYLAVLNTNDLATALHQLEVVEGQISAQRREVQEVVDKLTAEVMRRYRERAVSIDTLLP